MKRKLTVLIVEDEALYADLLEDLLAELGHEHLATLTNAKDALNFLSHTTPDLLLLDIQIEGAMDGIELADSIQEQGAIPVIFITSKIDDATYARAKATAPYAFLEKTSRKRQLQRAIDLVTTKITPSESPSESSDALLIRVGNTLVKVRFEEIVYVQAEDHYCNLYTLDKKFVSRISLKEMLQILPQENFSQVHRSYLIRFAAIQSIAPSEGTIHAVGGHAVPLGRSYKEALLKRMKLI